MRRDSEHRLSMRRRIARCERLLNRLFPLSESHGIHWSHCVNLDTMTIEFEDRCPLAQITMCRTFSDACKKIGVPVTDPVWQHCALQRYNFPAHDRPWDRDWGRREIIAADAALRKLFERKRIEFPKPSDTAQVPNRAA